MQKNCCAFEKKSNFYILNHLEGPKPLQYSLIYDRNHNFKPFGCGGIVKPWEKKSDWESELMNHNGVFRATPGFARIC